MRWTLLKSRRRQRRRTHLLQMLSRRTRSRQAQTETLRRKSRRRKSTEKQVLSKSRRLRPVRFQRRRRSSLSMKSTRRQRRKHQSQPLQKRRISRSPSHDSHSLLPSAWDRRSFTSLTTRRTCLQELCVRCPRAVTHQTSSTKRSRMTSVNSVTTRRRCGTSGSESKRAAALAPGQDQQSEQWPGAAVAEVQEGAVAGEATQIRIAAASGRVSTSQG